MLLIQCKSFNFPSNPPSSPPPFQMFDDNASGIHFTTGKRHRGSANSLSSLAGSMRRVNTASSFFKRLLSRSDSQSQPAQAAAATDGSHPGNSSKMVNSASNASLAGSKIILAPPRITEQVIEEVDEQMTITSMRQEVRPRADDLFNQGPITTKPPLTGPPPASKPVDMPMRTLGAPSSTYNRTHSTVGHHMYDKYMEKDDYMSSSAPTTQFCPPTPPGYDEFDRNREADTTGSGAAVEGEEEANADDFERLRLARERERSERQRLNIARSISTTQGSSNPTNLNVDLVEALATSIADDINQSGA